MEDKTVADAILDRVLSDALRVSLTGDFMRQRGDQNLAASPEEKASPTKGVHETQGNRERLRNQSLKIPLGVVAKERIAKEREYPSAQRVAKKAVLPSAITTSLFELLKFKRTVGPKAKFQRVAKASNKFMFPLIYKS